MTTLGQAIRRRREQIGLSQDKLAEKAGVNRTYCGDIERGEYAITVLTLFKLAKALGVSAESLIRDAESAFDDSATTPPVAGLSADLSDG